MIWNSIRGHGERVEWFRRTLRRGRLSHAYVFAGPDGVGKRLFAKTLAQCLFCQRHSNEELLACGECSGCKQVQAGSHPDLHEVERKKGKSEFTIDLLVGSQENRGREGLCYDLSLLPMMSDRKIAIIDDATSMNSESMNAFLKTLEEPQPHALLVLIADNLDALLPTIRSRCQTIRFDPLSPRDVAELLVPVAKAKNKDITPAEAIALAELSGGSLTVATELLEPALREMRDSLYQQLGGEFNSAALTEKLNSGIEAIGGDAATQRRNALWLVRFGLEFFRTAMLHLSDRPEGTVIPAAAAFARRFGARSPEDFEFVMSLFERMAETEHHIESNVSVARCVEVLCEDLGRKLRPARR
ncbi:MAG: DNA polymerase III subunit delta' [Planctomycetaceae bacterium]